MQCAAAADATVALCVAILLLLLQKQQCCCFLLVFIVCRMTKFDAGPMNLIPVFYFSLFQARLIFNVPLVSTVPFMASVTGMRGAMTGVIPPRRSLPVCICSGVTGSFHNEYRTRVYSTA